MFVEILAAIGCDGYTIRSTILNLDNINSIRLRKSRATNFLNPNCFPAIEYRDCDGLIYCELFQSDDIALNRYNKIRTCLAENSCCLIPLDDAHKNDPLREYFDLFGGTLCAVLDQKIQEYNRQILEGNKQEDETISEWLNNFVEARKKAREAERTKEGKNLL